MQGLLSKEHYCYKTHKSLMESSASPASLDNPLYGLPSILQEKILISPSVTFQKSQRPYK